MHDKIKQYLDAHPSHKLLISEQEIPGFRYTDVDYALSVEIEESGLLNSIGVSSGTLTDSLFGRSVLHHPVFGNYLAIKNCGILLEPELKLNFEHILRSYSRNYLFLVKWEGQLDDEYLYFLKRNTGITINLKGISRLIL